MFAFDSYCVCVPLQTFVSCDEADETDYHSFDSEESMNEDAFYTFTFNLG